jgi:heat shock protein HtpX
VTRRFRTRTLGLSLRMGLTMLLVIALYASIAAGVIVLIVLKRTWSVFVLVIAAGLIVATTGHVRSASGFLLRAAGAQPLPLDHELGASAQRLAQLADVPSPRLYLVESGTPNAFTVGTSPRSSRIALTSALLDTLEPDEIEAVLAHELSHVANRDAVVMTFASVPRALGETMIGEQGAVFFIWWVVWWIGIPIWAIGSLLTLTLSRYREFAADRGSALLTGRPELLMSALEKLQAGGAAIPDDDLRNLSRVEALWIVASGGTRFRILSDHPPLEDRLARLAEMTRNQGRTVGP